MGRSSRQKINKEALALDDPLDQMNLIHIYREHSIQKPACCFTDLYIQSTMIVFLLRIGFKESIEDTKLIRSVCSREAEYWNLRTLESLKLLWCESHLSVMMKRLNSLGKDAYWRGREIISDVWDGVIFWKSLLIRGFSYLYGRRNPPANGGNEGLIPGSKRSPGEGNGYPLQFPCLGNPTDRGAWWVTVHGVAKELDMS